MTTINNFFVDQQSSSREIPMKVVSRKKKWMDFLTFM